MTPWQCRQAVRVIHDGGVIAYPTEAVYGLGCDPLDLNAVAHICQIKQRSLDKGLLLIASSVDQARPFTSANKTQLQKLATRTTRPTTWVLPASDDCPLWLTGLHDSIAIRLTHHPIAHQLCAACRHALVSTSANVSRHRPARSAYAVQRSFGTQLDMLVHGSVNADARPSEIRDAITNHVYRAG